MDPAVLAHLEWLGFVQPTGLVVSPTALVRAGAFLPRNDSAGQAALLEHVTGERILDFEAFARGVLDWSFHPKGFATEPAELAVDFAIRDLTTDDGWQLLVTVGEESSQHADMERLLRETGVPAGLVVNGDALRLISAPPGESSGWLEFRVADMAQTAGRPIVAALRLLLSQARLLTLPSNERLAALLAASRRYQNEVSVKLAQQVLHALYELLRGLQAADDASGGELLREPLREYPDEVYHALLTVILRLLFILYAEEREMLPADETFVRYYSLASLYERLREDAARHPDTMDQRYGAWAQLLVLSRLVFDGGHGMPPRRGGLFDPEAYRFLEGRSGARQAGERIEPPRVPDGTVLRALEKLLVLDGERLSYRALDVEQIGSVYETMMGFRLRQASGPSVAVKAAKAHGAPTALDLDALLAVAPGQRAKEVKERADRKLAAGVAANVRTAETVTDLHAALAPVVDRMATPDLVGPGALVLQPSEERRRSGSHYTPRALTEPIVRTTLEPVLAALRSGEAPPRPEAILELKVCDPATGSGAFLVEACRQLGEALRDAWRVHGGRPEILADEDEVVHARRLVAQRCLYGVDKNPVAVDLAKLSLWLVTLAREHAFTFLDHALRHGDSLVGLTARQIEAFDWKPGAQPVVGVGESVARAAALRDEIRLARDDIADAALHQLWEDAQEELAAVRLYGDLAVTAFFSEAKDRDRETARLVALKEITEGGAEARRPDGVVPFHWQIEFPEVFDRPRPGFDAIVGNPPFMGGSKISGDLGGGYRDWLLALHEGSHGNADLVAHFFRRAFGLLRKDGSFGLIATNTIGQGDTRGTGLRWICQHGGAIFAARKRLRWPGMAAVVVSVVNVTKGVALKSRLDGHEVERISAFLIEGGADNDPARLAANAGQTSLGVKVLGNGFTFDDIRNVGIASPLSEMRRLLADDPATEEAIFPYLGGEEVNDSPTHAHSRFVINFRDATEAESRRRWPSLLAIIEERVKPVRATDNRESYRRYWWQFAEKRTDLWRAIAPLDRVLALSRHSHHTGFAFLPADVVYSEALVVFAYGTNAAFAALQSRPHEIWARFFGSSMKDDLRYTPSDCFETFPFPSGWTDRADLEEAGRAYYEHRAELMIANDEGLTKTYNRFHDQEEASEGILELRRLHERMDRAVLDAYGWTDVPTDCDFFLEHIESTKRRYRWPDAVRDDVLGRLIALNGERAASEQRSGAAAQRRKPKAKPRQSETLL